MSDPPRSFPAFSWSHSRDRALLDCTRAYYWRYYGSHEGWRVDAEAETRLAYALKHLTTFPLVVGAVLHECARDAVLATLRRDTRPSFDAMLARVSVELNRVVLASHHRGAFMRDPKRVPMLREVWYTGRPVGPALAQAVMKAKLCLQTLVRAPVWADLEGCPPERVAVVDSPEAFVHEGWPVYAGPDLVYRPGGRRVVIVDWKTGEEVDAELQLAIYALYARKALGLRFRDGEWFGRVVNLATGDDTFHEITRLDLLRAAERIRDSVRAMHALLEDPEENRPLSREAFPLISVGQRRACQNCVFFALCEEELARTSCGQP